MRRGRFRIPGLSFSWRRALGVSAAEGRLSRRIGFPLTRAGRQRAVGRALGCMVPIFFLCAAGLVLKALAIAIGV